VFLRGGFRAAAFLSPSEKREVPRVALRGTGKGIYFRPDLLFVGSTGLYVAFGCVVGGRVEPFGTVTSRPWPPRGPISWY
jgi:hypothetical protein